MFSARQDRARRRCSSIKRSDSLHPENCHEDPATVAAWRYYSAAPGSCTRHPLPIAYPGSAAASACALLPNGSARATGIATGRTGDARAKICARLPRSRGHWLRQRASVQRGRRHRTGPPASRSTDGTCTDDAGTRPRPSDNTCVWQPAAHQHAMSPHTGGRAEAASRFTLTACTARASIRPLRRHRDRSSAP